MTGKLTATPQTVWLGQSTFLKWECDDPSGIELRVNTGQGEKVVAQGSSTGEIEIPWIREHLFYDFLLYGKSDKCNAVATCTVVCDDKEFARHCHRRRDFRHKMLCTVAIPTRERFDKVLRCVQSVFRASTGNYENFEVLLRLHRSDRMMSARLGDLEARLEPGQHFRVIWGDDLYGYRSLPAFYQELIDAAQGEYVWHVNDDMEVFGPATGPGWDFEMHQAIQDGPCLVQPELHKLNVSVYRHHANGPAPCHARKDLGLVLAMAVLQGSVAVDDIIHDYLTKNLRRPVRYMKDIGIFHNWGGFESHVDDIKQKEAR